MFVRADGRPTESSSSDAEVEEGAASEKIPVVPKSAVATRTLQSHWVVATSLGAVGAVLAVIAFGAALGFDVRRPVGDPAPAPTREALPWPPENFLKYDESKVGQTQSWLKQVNGLEDWEKALSLGDIDFQSQTSAESELARAHFTLGLLCLHNFMYDLAVEEFQKAQAAEKRGFPIAVWGEALSTKYMLWLTSDCKGGKSALKKLDDMDKYTWLTPIERDMVPTARALYPDDLDCADDTEYDREKRFVVAMKDVADKYPDNPEATLLYSVANFAVLSHPECEAGRPKHAECTKELAATRDRFKELYDTIPRHPGLLHYIMHSYDLPDVYEKANAEFLEMIEPSDTGEDDHVAALAVKASYDYLALAKSSCHAAHMPSHIFMRMGNWEMSAFSNIQSIRACDALSESRGYDYTYDKSNLYHSLEYLQNDFLQLGRYEAADQLLGRVDAVVDANLRRESSEGESESWKETLPYLWWQYRMHARQMLDTYDWHPIPHAFGGALPRSVIDDSLSDGQRTWAALAEGGALLEIGLAAAKYREMVEGTKAGYPLSQACIDRLAFLKQAVDERKGVMNYVKAGVAMFSEELLAVVTLAEAVYPDPLDCLAKRSCTPRDAKLKDVFAHLDTATHIQREQMRELAVTPTVMFIPSFELYGHVLLLLGGTHVQKAEEMFEEAIKQRMGRTLSVVGLARALALQKQTDKASHFYKHVEQQMRYSDAGNRLALEAHQFLHGRSHEISYEWPYPR